MDAVSAEERGLENDFKQINRLNPKSNVVSIV
jgi:hypothetical protein